MAKLFCSEAAMKIATDAVTTAKIDDEAVTNAKLSAITGPTVKGRVSGSGAPQELTQAQLTDILLPFEEDFQGVVNGPTAADITANRILQAEITLFDQLPAWR